MNEVKQSDEVIVPKKAANKGAQVTAELPEGRTSTKGNPQDRSTGRTQGRGTVFQAVERIRQAVMRNPKERLTALLHHITPDTLRWAFYSLKSGKAAGADGVLWEEYEEGLEERLHDLNDRVHKGTYRAKPVRRVEIPKPDGGTRPLGIAALEDKIVQKDADIQKFLDRIDRDWMIRFLEHRIGDRRVIRLITKWLNAGVMEDGEWKDDLRGTPQGAVVSPVLANIYLHYVLDLWFHKRWRVREAKGEAVIVRFECKEAAEQFLEDIKERLSDWGASRQRNVWLELSNG